MAIIIWQRTGLSGRLVLLTLCFVMLSEILILFPSLGNFWENRLRDHLEAAQIAVLALEAAPDYMVSQELSMMLLQNAGVAAVALRRKDQRVLALGMEQPPTITESVDLRTPAPLTAITQALGTLVFGGKRFDGGVLRVIGNTMFSKDDEIEIIVTQAPLRVALLDYSLRILLLSTVISGITAALVFFAIRQLMVRPTQHLTANMIAFRETPENADLVIQPSGRRDEIGIMERELAMLQTKIRADLVTRGRLAALGLAVGKISHDLRNMLASAQLLSNRIGKLEDAEASRLAPGLIASIDRAIALCARSLRLGKEEAREPQRHWFALYPLVEEVGQSVDAGDGRNSNIRWINQVAEDFHLYADSEQIFRILMNLGRNGVRALEMGRRGGQIIVSARRENQQAVIEVSDDGPGVPRQVREWLEKDSSARGTDRIGLGLAITRELTRLHGGKLILAPSDGVGACFSVFLPQKETREIFTDA